jgi:peptide subunit release factor 1 (eRF1)
MAGTGAPDEVLDRLDGVVEGAHQHGAGLVAIANGSGILLVRNLATPVEDSASWSPAPALLPLVAWQQENPPYAVVLADRTGAQIEVTSSWRPDWSQEVAGDEWPLRRVNPGGWSQRRFQERAENLWEENAKEVADALEKIATDDDLELVVISGDVRAAGFLKEHLPEAFSPTIYEIEGTQAQSVEEIAEELHKSVAAHEAQATEDLLDRFREERGQEDRAVEGAGRTARALSEARVETLLVAVDAVGQSGYSIADDPVQVSPDQQALESLQMGEVIELPMRHALVRSAMAGGSAVRVIPSMSDEHGPADGVGAILRYTY